MTSKVKALVADDSAFMPGAIARLSSADDRFEVVGQATPLPCAPAADVTMKRAAVAFGPRCVGVVMKAWAKTARWAWPP